MVKPSDTSQPWQQIETQAFYAFREWPLWLVLRERELAQRTAGTPSGALSPAPLSQAAQPPQRN